MDEMDDIGAMLESEPLLEPPRDFTRRVMAGIEREVTAPPLPFPWHRAMVVAMLMLSASLGVAGAPALREPARRLFEAIGGCPAPLVSAAMGALLLSMVIATWTLWISWRAE